MECLDLTLPTPAENLACEEVLADACEAGGPEVLRFWEARTTFVVAGYANRLAAEVNLPACRADGIPVFRRVSGGGTVLQMPGVLNYALVLHLSRPELATVTDANRYIMARNAGALGNLLGRPVQVRGHTDLAVGDRKFSGNAQRRFRNTVLFHGAILLSADLPLLARYLNFPSKQPDYRQGRGHLDFVTNLELSAAVVKTALQHAWLSPEPCSSRGNEAHSFSGGEDQSLVTSAATWPGNRFSESIAKLVAEKYSRIEWNERF
jgi:lipoate-protein ligase A